MIGKVWNAVFFYPILNILLLLYSLLGNNLGLAIVVLTVILRAAMFPMTRSQMESTLKMRKIQPELEKIKKKYPANQQKVQEEQLKLYRKVGYNPLGCFVSTLLPFPILIAIYQAINAFSTDKVVGIYNFVKDWLNISGDIHINTQFLFWDLSKAYLPLAKEHGYFELWLVPYFLLAVLTGLSQYYSVKINSMMTGGGTDSKKKEDVKSEKNEKGKRKKEESETPDMGSMMKDMNKSMMLTFPVMTGLLALSMPSAVSLYWCLQSWLTVGVQVIYVKLKRRKK